MTIEGGGRINWSSPGSVTTGRGYGAITVGRERQRFITLGGRRLRGLPAHRRRGDRAQVPERRTCSLSWREWVSDQLGTFVQLDWYDNPYYTRTGVTIGLFRHW